MNVFVVYDTKYGNTKRVSETIVEGLQEVEEIKIAISDVEEVDIDNVANSDAILIGAPNHIGRPTRTIRKFIDQLGKRDLTAKWVAVFDTCLGGDFDKALLKRALAKPHRTVCSPLNLEEERRSAIRDGFMEMMRKEFLEHRSQTNPNGAQREYKSGILYSIEW